MLKPGALIGDNLEAGSMAEAIELAMVAQGLLDLDEETPEAAENRRKTFIAIATGVINHLKGNLQINVMANKFAVSVPAVAKTLLGSAGDVQ